MKFEQRKDPDHGGWWISENEAFAIGVLDYLFGQKCIQVLYREIPEGHWWVIQEWRTYRVSLVEALVEDMRNRLGGVEADFGEWEVVEQILPGKKAKYLENEPG